MFSYDESASNFAKAVDLHRKGLLEPAEQLYRSILGTTPGHAPAAHGLGVLYLQRGRTNDGIGLLDIALATDPNLVTAHLDRGLALQAIGRKDEAVGSFDRAIALNPTHLLAHYYRGNVLQELMRIDEAIADYDHAIALAPDFVAALNNRANALRMQNRLVEALESYDRAVAFKADEPLTQCNRGVALQDLGRFDEALKSYDRAIALRPDYHAAFRSRGTLKLLQGRMREGFADFEHRLLPEDLSAYSGLQQVRRWSGENLAGKSIVVWSDGAFGDLAQFCRYLPVLASWGARVALLAPSRFRKVLATDLLGVCSVSSVSELGGADYRCELLSLPFLLKTEISTIPRCIGHLSPDGVRVQKWAKELPTNCFNVGICWQGNPQRHIDRGRSVPLAEFYPLSQVPGVRLVSLQKHHGLDQLQSLPQSMHVEVPASDFDEGPDAFLDTAAMMAGLDLVVTSDTAVAHLAAALGRPTWIALRYVPEWRWLLDRSDSPWYSSVRLFRQTQLDKWGPVFEEMATALRREILEKKTAS